MILPLVTRAQDPVHYHGPLDAALGSQLVDGDPRRGAKIAGRECTSDGVRFKKPDDGVPGVVGHLGIVARMIALSETVTSPNEKELGNLSVRLEPRHDLLKRAGRRSRIVLSANEKDWGLQHVDKVLVVGEGLPIERDDPGNV